MRGLHQTAGLLVSAVVVSPALGFLVGNSRLPSSLSSALQRRPLPRIPTTTATTSTTTMMAAAPRGTGGSKSLIDSLFAGGSGGGRATKPGGAGRKEGQGAALVRQYFELWNERRMQEAVELFTEDCSYEDTLYSGAFEGRAALRKYVVWSVMVVVGMGTTIA